MAGMRGYPACSHLDGDSPAPLPLDRVPLSDSEDKLCSSGLVFRLWALRGVLRGLWEPRTPMPWPVQPLPLGWAPHHTSCPPAPDRPGCRVFVVLPSIRESVSEKLELYTENLLARRSLQHPASATDCLLAGGSGPGSGGRHPGLGHHSTCALEDTGWPPRPKISPDGATRTKGHERACYSHNEASGGEQGTPHCSGNGWGAPTWGGADGHRAGQAPTV